MKKKKVLGVYGGSFSPPGLHHYLIAKAVAPRFDTLFIVPCGGDRKDKTTGSLVSPSDRLIMTSRNFIDIPQVRFDFSDLTKGFFRPNNQLEEEYQKWGEVWHVVGPDIIKGGARGESEIQCKWEKGRHIWQNLNFAVVKPEGCEWNENDLPPRHKIIEMESLTGRSKCIREAIAAGKTFEHMTRPKVAKYIEKHKLYGCK